jgi:hypothetical protein
MPVEAAVSLIPGLTEAEREVQNRIDYLMQHQVALTREMQNKSTFNIVIVELELLKAAIRHIPLRVVLENSADKEAAKPM